MSMPDPLVSLLMPVYNAEATLAEALESLAGQTLGDFEIVAVDDGSQDGSGRLLRQWQAREPRLRPVFAPHAGLLPALNAGLARCRGVLVARMDADDRCHPRRLEKQVALLRQRPDLGVVGSLVETFPRETVGEGFRLYEEWLNRLVTHEQISREIFIESPIVHPSALVRRAELLALGGYQERGWPEDYDLWLRYLVGGHRFAKVPEVLFYWREHPSRLTHTDRRYSVENFLRAKAWYLIRGPLRERDALIVWGAGKTGRRLAKHLVRGGRPPAAFVDIDARKVGGTLRGAPVVGPDSLPGVWRRWQRPLLVVAVASRGARALIRQELERLQLAEGEDFLCAA
jgi:glycosyltransferase involved in cell wall biosynthesis